MESGDERFNNNRITRARQIFAKLNQSGSHWFLCAFWAIAAAEIISIPLQLDVVQQIAKPLLMISLLLYFWTGSQGFPGWRRWVFGALCFSWLGDILLMNDALFVAGLGSFLIGHLFYIAVYTQTGARTGTLKTMDAIRFILIGVVLMRVLFPGLGNMLIPVLAYAFVLLLMAVYAHKRRYATTDRSFTLVSLGATLFVISDSIIAVDRFAFKLPYGHLWVMTTYIAAQYLIIRGLLRHDPGSQVNP